MADWEIRFSARCEHVAGHGYRCMICAAAATGHAAVSGGPYHGRCLALTCPRHGSPDGWEEFKAGLLGWAEADLLAADGGPGINGTPEAWHDGHWDPMPACAGDSDGQA